MPEKFPNIASFHTFRVNHPAGWFYTTKALSDICDVWEKYGSGLINFHGSTGDIILLGAPTENLQACFDSLEGDLPVYAECAGLMYLCRGINWQGKWHEMVGAIAADVKMFKRPQGHGYVVAEVTVENPLFPVGLTVRGHEFHHSNLSNRDDAKFAYQIRRGRGVDGKGDGIVYKNVFAAYTHIHALGTPNWAEAFVALASKEGKCQISASVVRT